MTAELRAIALLLRWAARVGIDLDQRISAGTLLHPAEITALRDALRLNQITGKAVVPVVHYVHCMHVRDYIKWRSEHVIQRLKLDDPRFDRSRVRLDEFQKNMMQFLAKPRGGSREGITSEAERILLDVVRPGASGNPFHPRHQHRNQALVLTYVRLGVRRSEALVLKGIDLDLHGPEPSLVVHRRADDPDDTRLDQPLVKTASRILPLGDELREALMTWVTRHRVDPGRYPGAKRVPFVFVSQRGTALTKRAVSRVFAALARVPGLEGISAHLLRHRWNDTFSELCDETGVPEEKEMDQRNNLMGWKKHSRMSQTYTSRSTRAAAAKSSLDLQRKMSGGSGTQTAKGEGK